MHPLWPYILCAVSVTGLVGYSLAPVVARWWARRRWPETCEPIHCARCGTPDLIHWDAGQSARDYQHGCGAHGAIIRSRVGAR